MDETIVGGKLKNMHESKKSKGTVYCCIAGGAIAKTIVVGMLECKAVSRPKWFRSAPNPHKTRSSISTFNVELPS
jgi:hypothetical protein